MGAMALVLAAPGMAAAQTAAVNIGNAYAGASLGIIIPDDLSATFSGAVAGTGNLTFYVGPAITGHVGYHFNKYLAAEGELGFAIFDAKNFNGTLNGTAVFTSADAHIHTITGFTNAIVTPLGRSGFSPYVGAGIGLVNFSEEVESVGGLEVESNSNETDFAANFIAGFDFAISGRWSVGGRYRFVWANTASMTTSGGITTSQGNFTAHLLTAAATFRF